MKTEVTLIELANELTQTVIKLATKRQLRRALAPKDERQLWRRLIAAANTAQDLLP